MMKKATSTQRVHIKPGTLLRYALVVLLATILLVPVGLQSAFAEPTAAEKQAEADEVSARLAAMEAETEVIRNNYWAAVEEHEAALAAMEEAQVRIDIAEAIIADTQARLGYRANQMYRQGPYTYLEVIFGTTTFEAFTSSWDLLNLINQENANLIQANKDARAEAKAAHEEYSAQERIAAAKEAEIELIKANAEALIAEQQALLANLEAEVAALVEKEQTARLSAQADANRSSLGNGFNAPGLPPGGYGSAVAAAASRIGCPYVPGGSGPNEFDCSGLTSWCYAQAGVSIGRSDSSQYGSAAYRVPYSSGEASPGDILWWPGHVAIYAGGDSYIHAPYPGASVCYSSWDIGSATILRF